MGTHEESIPRDEWLENAQALRRLAASLVGDEHEANDLVQETWLRTKDDRRAEGPWLRTVLRNLVRDRSRERARRSWSEREAARDEELPSAFEVAERLDVAQRVALEVARLSEPYRTVIHLRYFEGLSPEEIARRAQVPLETVRTRLRRGLEELRERMDGAYGGRRDAWSVALATLAWRSKPASIAKVGGTIASVGGVLMSLKLVAFAAVLVVASSVYLWQRSSSSEPSEHALASSSRQIDASHERTEMAGPDEHREITHREVAMPVSARANGDAVPDSSIEVRGTVVITDENGRDHTDESGVMKIATGTTEADAKLRDLAFEHGAWSTRVPAGQWIAFLEMTSNQRDVLLPNPKPIVIGTEPIVVRGEWLKRGSLRVIDAVTKEELRDVEVRCCDACRANPEWTHPGDDARMKPVVEHGTSPIDLPDRKEYTPYWVHAPHHAWARIDFQHRTGGQRTIELSPTPSSVVIEIDGDLTKQAIVRLYPTEKTRADVAGGTGIVFKMPEPDQMPSWLAVVSARASVATPTRIDDLQPGKLLATVEVGEYEEKLRIGSAPIEVKAGETAHVTVPIDASLLSVPRTHLFGTVEVPELLDRGAYRLKLSRVGAGEKEFQQSLAEMSHTKGEPNVVHWDAGPMRTGDYLVNFTNIQYGEVIHAPSPGETKLALTVPALSRVTVEVLDAATGAKVAPERLQWTRGPVKGTSNSVLAHVQPNLKTGQFEFVAPRGEVELDVTAQGYEEMSKKFTLTSDAETCRLELHRATAIHVVMREGDAAMSPGYPFLSNVRAQRDGTRDHPYNALGSRESETTCFVETTGRYRIEFPALAGFEPIEPRMVDVAAGQTVDVVVHVKRMH